MNKSYLKIKEMSPQFLVADLERALDFYTDQLGFELYFRYEDFYASITKDGNSIHLKLGIPTVAERTNKRENEHLDLMFSVEHIRGLFEALKGRQVTIIQPLRQMPYGHEFYIIDPDGYILGFIEET